MCLQGEERESRKPAGPERREPLLVAIRETRDRDVLEVEAVGARERAAWARDWRCGPCREGMTSR